MKTSLSRKQIDDFTNIASEGAGGLAYITYQDGEGKSPIAKFLSEKSGNISRKLVQLMAMQCSLVLILARLMRGIRATCVMNFASPL